MEFSTETERLYLRPLNEKDSSFILELVNTKGWLEFIGDRKIYSLENAIEYIAMILHNNNYHYTVIEEKSKHIPIGVVSFLQRDNHPYPDLGYAMLPEYEHQGFAFEACQTFLQYLKEHTATDTIIAIAKSNNHKSIKLLQKLGFTFQYNYIEFRTEQAVYQLNLDKEI